MAITLSEAKAHLNKEDSVDDDELRFFVDAANEWIANEVADPSTFTARLATRMLVAHWWETQRGPAGGPLDDAADSGSRGAWFSIPNKVRELLQSKNDQATSPQFSFPDAGSWPDPIAT